MKGIKDWLWALALCIPAVALFGALSIPPSPSAPPAPVSAPRGAPIAAPLEHHTPQHKLIPTPGPVAEKKEHEIPPETEAPSPEPVAEKKPANPGDPQELGWDVLNSFTYKGPRKFPGPDKKDETLIPADIRKLSGSRVVVTGYMVPMNMEGQTVSEFLLLRQPYQCCYGTPPEITEWLHVKVDAGKEVEYAYTEVSFTGILLVDEEYDDGWLMSIYNLKGAELKP